MKPKKCKVCKVSFVPTKPLQAVCDFRCAIELNLINRQKKENKEKALEVLVQALVLWPGDKDLIEEKKYLEEVEERRIKDEKESALFLIESQTGQTIQSDPVI